LGSWNIDGRDVELSEVTMPDFSQPSYLADHRRFIGITYANPEGARVVDSWDELNAELFGAEEEQ